MCKMYEIIEQLCDGRGIKPGRMCADLGISRGIMGDLKAGRTKKLSAENMEKVASYFGVSTDYLLGNESSVPKIFLSDYQQKLIYETLNASCEQLDILQGEAIARSHVSYNFFPRLKNETLHTANKQDLLSVARFLGVAEKITVIIEQSEDGKSESSESIASWDNEDSLTQEEMKLVSMFRELSNQGKEYIFQQFTIALQIYTKKDSVPDMGSNAG